MHAPTPYPSRTDPIYERWKHQISSISQDSSLVPLRDGSWIAKDTLTRIYKTIKAAHKEVTLLLYDFVQYLLIYDRVENRKEQTLPRYTLKRYNLIDDQDQVNPIVRQVILNIYEGEGLMMNIKNPFKDPDFEVKRLKLKTLKIHIHIPKTGRL